MDKYDFSGWATRNDLKCSDGRVILRDAFKHNDGHKVPLVWNHQHNEPFNVLGHAMLENRKEGVYAYCSFNDTESGENAKLLVQHGDVVALSIYANQLKQQGPNVLHGAIREVSLVLSGANPGAFIDSIITHGEASEEAVIYTGEDISLLHAEEITVEVPEPQTISHAEAPIVKEAIDTKEKNMATGAIQKPESEETIEDVFNTLSEKQKNVVYALIGQAIKGDDEEGDDEEMKQNVFEGDNSENTLSHADTELIFSDAKRYGSLKDAVLAHGITDIDFLFPDAQNMDNMPGFITREQTWVNKVMSGVHHSPFSRIKSMHANLTADEARAKGYITGNLKVDEVFTLLKRTTTPTTIYKKQKLDRDDVIDIVDFDVVSWLKAEMRMMLDEEIARAALVGDGRISSSDDKINELNIRPIWTDDALYTIKQTVNVAAAATDSDKVKEFIRSAIKSRKNYKGSGNPTLFTTEDVLTDCLLLNDSTGRVIYDSVDKLATALRVKEIVAVPVMEGLKRTVDLVDHNLMGIIVNLEDYNVGADKGGAVNMFDDFDIDYNAQKYLIETRCSGALTKPYSAIALELVVAAAG